MCATAYTRHKAFFCSELHSKLAIGNGLKYTKIRIILPPQFTEAHSVLCLSFLARARCNNLSLTLEVYFFFFFGQALYHWTPTYFTEIEDP